MAQHLCLEGPGEMESGTSVMIPLGSQEGPVRRRRELNLIPDLFHY